MSCPSCTALASKAKTCWRHPAQPAETTEKYILTPGGVVGPVPVTSSAAQRHILFKLVADLNKRQDPGQLSITFVDTKGESPALDCRGTKIKDFGVRVDAWLAAGTPMWVNVYRDTGTGKRYEDRIAYMDLAMP